MRIGELLLQRKLRPSELAKALEEQATSKRRLTSLLIARGLIDFDDGSRALGDQKGVPCALAKHLANRDESLAKLFPEELGRASCALPIGRTSKGVLIVCVRDPEPAVLAALQTAVRGEVLMVIAPATRLEHLIAAAYGANPAEEFDVDLGSSPNLPPLPDLESLDPASVRLSLTDLDDARVTKVPSKSGQHAVVGPAVSRTATNRPPPSPGELAPSQPRTTLPAPPPTLESTAHALERATTREEATDRALTYLAGRWVSALVLAVRDSTALGYRGHGVQVRGGVESIVLPLALPSTVQRAVESRRISVQTPAGPAQEQLGRLLNTPHAFACAPVTVAGQVVAVLVVGDPVQGAGDVPEANVALGKLALVLGGAYDRVRRG